MPEALHGVFVTGTNTGVGKTRVGMALLRALAERGMTLQPRKPVESGWPEQVEKSDAWQLAHAAQNTATLDVICPNRFTAAISPVRAAAMQGVQLEIAAVAAQCQAEAARDDFLYVEGAGGFYSPLTADGLNADLAQALGLPLLLVAKDRLGVISQVLLTVEAIHNRGLELHGVVLNRISEHPQAERAMDNAQDLRALLDVPVFGFERDQQQADDALVELLCATIF